MDANRKVYRKGQEYVNGSAVRKLQPVSFPREDERDIREKRKRKEEQERLRRQQNRKTKKRLRTAGVEKKSLLLFSCTIVLTLSVCVDYLAVQSGVSRMRKEVAALESSLLLKKNSNDAALERVESSINLKEIYEKATKKLGMIHPKQKQIIRYENEKNDYVRQYGNIPRAKDDTILDAILK